MPEKNPVPSSFGNQVLVDNVVTQNLPKGYHFATHLHRAVELLICLSGTIHITIQGVSHIVSSGEYMVVFPDIPHSADVPALASCSILQIHFHECFFFKKFEQHIPMNELAFSFELSLGKRKFCKSNSSPPLQACLEGIRNELQCRQENSEKMMYLYILQLNILLSRDLRAQTSNSAPYENPYLFNATLFIHEHYMDKLTVAEVAQAVGVSSRYLTKLFDEHLNLGVSTYITYVRISKSIDYKYMNPHYPLTDLALDMGFGSQQHFSKVFKEKMGVSPKKYFSLGTASH